MNPRRAWYNELMNHTQMLSAHANKQAWLVRRYIVYQVLTNMWFLGAVWLYFYRIYITDQQIGLLDAMAFSIGLLAEVPSGALADKFGRDKMVRLGQILTGVGLLIQIAGSSFVPFVVGQAIMMIGISFVSGADDALFFEQLKFDKRSTRWRKLVTRGSQAALVATILTTILGGWLHYINPRIPWLLTALAFICSAILIWPIKDTRAKRTREPFAVETLGYLHDIKIGFVQFRLPRLWIYVPIILAVQGLFYTTGFGILRLILLSRFHFSPLTGSIAVAACGVITVVALEVMHRKAERLSEKWVIGIVSVSAALSLLLATAAGIGPWGLVVILTLYLGEHALSPFMSEVLNRHAPENQRATVLSVASFLKTLPYVGLGPLIGALNTHGHLRYFLVIWACIVAATAALYLATKKQDVLIATPDNT